uniref:IF rod domain-containing protein n=1 Tax=Leptobrachium leishanense TaxID=445787 RepID=A0A8C5WK45_9ANUR
MSHSVKQSHYSSGSYKGKCHAGGQSFSSSRSKGDYNISRQANSQGSQRAGHQRSPSVHGGSGGKGISFSRNSSFSSVSFHGNAQGGHGGHVSSFGNHNNSNKKGMFSFNEKETMQSLNDRLATYLEKVHSLESQNAQLEKNIREWYERNQPSAFPDFSNYFKSIRELQSQVSSATVENARIILQIDNARLSADDFRTKYEMEHRMSKSIEEDLSSLRRVLEGQNRDICNLGEKVQSLQGELQQMKRNHEEEVNCLQAQLGQRVNVEVNAAPSVDLNRTLSDIRQQYENLMERNLREVENMFLQRTEELNQQLASRSDQLQSVQTEAIDLKRTIQALEIELQSQQSLAYTLAEIESSFRSQLSQLQGLINNVESQLEQIRSDLERQNHEYKRLMDQKTHLEMEIATYKGLLDGHDLGYAFNQSFENSKGDAWYGAILSIQDPSSHYGASCWTQQRPCNLMVKPGCIGEISEHKFFPLESRF